MSDARTVLWVDDDETQLALASIIAQTRGWTIFTAGRPEGAIAAYGEYKPDAVVLDVILKTYSTDRRSGIDICNTIREKDKDTIIVFSTGVSGDFLKLETKMAKADWTFIKPNADPNDILTKIEEIQKKRQNAKSLAAKIPSLGHSQWGIFHFTGRELAQYALNLIFFAVVLTFLGILTGAVLSIKDDVSLLKGQAIATDKAVSRIQGKNDALQEKK